MSKLARTCPCGSGASLPECCGRYLDAGETAETAEALMRSRYTAYTLARIDYITATHDPETRDTHDPEQARNWAERSEWLGLEILSTSAGGPGDEEGTVEFIARYRTTEDGDDVEHEHEHEHEHENENENEHRERSFFVRRDGAWYFTDGKVLGPRPRRLDAPKVGRNDPCPCGSGKKYKKCCGRA